MNLCYQISLHYDRKYNQLKQLKEEEKLQLEKEFNCLTED